MQTGSACGTAHVDDSCPTCKKKREQEEKREEEARMTALAIDLVSSRADRHRCKDKESYDWLVDLFKRAIEVAKNIKKEYK